MKWYDKEEEYLQRLHIICKTYSQKFMNLYIITHRTQTKLRLPSIILSSCSGVASFGSSGFQAATMKKITIAVGVVNIAIAILQTYESYLKIGDIVSKSLVASQSLTKLADDIECELFIPIENRNANGITYLRDCYNRYKAIMDQAPPMEEMQDAKILKVRLTNEIEEHNRISRTAQYENDVVFNLPNIESAYLNSNSRNTDLEIVPVTNVNPPSQKKSDIP